LHPSSGKRFAAGAITVGLVALTGLGWGLLGPASKLLFNADPTVFDGVTVTIARATWALPFFLFSLVLAWQFERPIFDPRTIATFVGIAVAFATYFVLFSIAAQHTSLAHLAFLSGLAPPVNSTLAALVLRARLDATRRTALVVGVLGVALLALTRPSDGSSAIGDGLMVLWLLDFAVYAILVRGVSTRYGMVFISALVGSLGTLVLTALGIALGAGRGIAHVTDTPAIGAAFFGEIVVLSALVSPLTFNFAIRRAGVVVATSGAEYIVVGVGIIASLAFFHEHWQPLLGLAGALLLASLVLTFLPVRVRPTGREGERSGA